MIGRVLLALALAFSISACGTKTRLETPSGKKTPKDQVDPAQPPQPINK